MKSLRYLAVISLVIVLASCESKTFLRSKKKLEKDIQGHWRPFPGTSKYGTTVYDRNVQWIFDNGSVRISEVDASGNDHILDQGTYSISTKIDNCFLSIDGFTSRDYDSTYDFNIKWNIIQLNGSVLDIAGRPNNAGLVELEFKKQ